MCAYIPLLTMHHTSFCSPLIPAIWTVLLAVATHTPTPHKKIAKSAERTLFIARGKGMCETHIFTLKNIRTYIYFVNLYDAAYFPRILHDLGTQNLLVLFSLCFTRKYLNLLYVEEKWYLQFVYIYVCLVFIFIIWIRSLILYVGYVTKQKFRQRTNNNQI